MNAQIKQNHKFLQVSWSTSRGRDTYGYNICRLDDGPHRYRTCGGGYDMVGTVLGYWLTTQFQDELRTLTPYYIFDNGTTVKKEGLYGLSLNKKTGEMSIDGACGVSSVKSIAQAIGVDITDSYGRKDLKGFFVSW